MIPASIVFFAGVMLCEKGQRAWVCGTALMVFVIVTATAMLGFLALTPAFVKYVGPSYRAFAFPWTPALVGLAIILFIAVALLQRTRPARLPGEPLKIPDYQ
jgi:hypothetical protein